MSELGNSRVIVSNQDGLNEQLDEVVLKHLKHAFKKPYQQHTLDAFRGIEKWVEQQGKPLIFDSCCGVGESTYHIAKAHPEAIVLGMDKSADRLGKHGFDVGQKLNIFNVVGMVVLFFLRLWHLEGS